MSNVIWQCGSRGMTHKRVVEEFCRSYWDKPRKPTKIAGGTFMVRGGTALYYVTLSETRGVYEVYQEIKSPFAETPAKSVYGLECGRNITRNGKPFIAIQRNGDTHPCDADEIAHKIVDLLNKAEA